MEDQLSNEKFYNTDPALESSNCADHSHPNENQADLQTSHGTNSHNSSSGNFGSASASASGTTESEQMKVFVTNPNVTYHTRHARRIYVGGIPPNYSDEEELRNFFNKAISKGLDVENDNSYVISVYMNQKKCYAFVEFNSIELTTACLEMDGIIFKKVTLKIYRANEYRPELVPPTKFIKLDLSSWSFGLATGAGAGSANNAGGGPSFQPSSYMARPDRGTNGGFIAPHSSWRLDQEVAHNAAPECLASLIHFANITTIEPNSLVIVGFPYESSNVTPTPKQTSPKQPQQMRGTGTAAAPSCLRKSLSTYPCGAICNAELGLDLAEQPIIDVGDVLAGQSRSETQNLLSTTISELLLRGSVPFLVGGSRDQTYHSAMGLVAAAGVCVGVMNLSAQVDSTILDCPEFCNPAGGQLSPTPAHMRSAQRVQNCFGRYVQFGAQGAQCNAEAAKSITDRGGHIFWLHRDLRTASTESVAVAQFSRALRNLDACVVHDQQRKGVNTAAMRASFPQSHIMVSVDCGVLSGAANPLGGSSHSSVGLTAEEVLEIAFLAGAHPNVALFEMTEFRPDQESDSRLNLFLADAFYKFALGVASRTQAPRGGVQGAGASAVLTSNLQGSANLGVGVAANSPPIPAHYNRSPVMQNAAMNKNNTRVAVPYVPNREPQQQQQQARGVVFAPQQVQLPQPQLSARTVLPQQRGMTPFPTIPENATVNNNINNVPMGPNGTHRPLLKHYSAHNGSFNQHDEDPLLSDHHHHAHGQEQPGQPRQTRHSSYDNDEGSLSTALFTRSNSHNNGVASRQTSQQSNFNDSMYNASSSPANMRPNNNNNNINNNNNSINNNNNPYYQHGMHQMNPNNSFTNNNTNNNINNNPLSATIAGLSNLNTAHANSTWMQAPSPHTHTHAHSSATPTSLVTASQAYTPSSDWLNPNLSSRLSSHSTSTMSMLSNFRSTSSNLHMNSPSHSLGNLNLNNSALNSSFLLSGNNNNNLDDPMDKLIGVTNIGLVPAFDDPHDPLYSED